MAEPAIFFEEVNERQGVFHRVVVDALNPAAHGDHHRVLPRCQCHAAHATRQRSPATHSESEVAAIPGSDGEDAISKR